MNHAFDIIIIGAGPAGSACALSLANSGLRVALIDKSTFPRDKICGDAIPGPAFKAMNRINKKWGEAMQKFAASYYIKSGQVTSPNGKTMKLDWVTYSYNSKRIDFDFFLHQLVQAETSTSVISNTRLQELIITEADCQCIFQDGSVIHAALVIGCDGANSIVRRKIKGKEQSNEHACSAVRAYYKNVSGIDAGTNEFHFFQDLLPGYFWIFPLPNGWVNIGFGILQKKIGGHQRPVNLRHALTRIIKEMPSIAPRFANAEMMLDIQSFGLPLALKPNSLSGNRYMLCGDAASLIDPLQGHGIDHAMTSGHMAALQAMKCFKEHNFTADFMQQYDQSVYNKIGSELKRNTALLRLLSRAPWLLNLLTSIGQNQRLIEKVVRFFKI